MTPTAVGAWSFTLSIANTDSTENPYDWTVSGVAMSLPMPEFDVLRGGNSIASGAVDFFSGTTVGAAHSVTYALMNSGTCNPDSRKCRGSARTYAISSWDGLTRRPVLKLMP